MPVQTVYRDSWRIKGTRGREYTVQPDQPRNPTAEISTYGRQLTPYQQAAVADAASAKLRPPTGRKVGHEGRAGLGPDSRVPQSAGSLADRASATMTSGPETASAFKGGGATVGWAGQVGGGGVGGWWTPERQQHAVERLKEEAGLSEQGARGLVARWAGVEAPGGPESVNPSSGAVGVAQWLGARKAGTPRDFDGQITKAIGELNSTEGRAATKLRNARTAEEGAVGAAMFERAEGYNASTGRDLFVQKTMNTMATMYEETGDSAQAGKDAAQAGFETTKAPADAAPPEILARAQQVAAEQKNGKSVDSFMRENGYPRAGNWCGQFAGAVVSAAGGTPPAGAPVASNWRKYGVPVQGPPQPGDIAVRKGPATGNTGSHVTVVESFDPATGRFIGFGGNQSSWRSSYPADRFDFRRGGTGTANLEMARAATGGGNASVSRGSGGRGGTGGFGSFGGGMINADFASGPMGALGQARDFLANYAMSSAPAGGSRGATGTSGMPPVVKEYVESLSPRYREAAIRMYAAMTDARLGAAARSGTSSMAIASLAAKQHDVMPASMVEQYVKMSKK